MSFEAVQPNVLLLPKPSLLRAPRIMLEPSEVVRGEDGSLSATLDAADSRAAHVRSVLKAEDGQTVRVGVVDAGL